ncbi:MAG: hypothetical protein OEW99_07200 [Gammaproteobacteria bacterium]|nr:hypothetical protein [Gammaproteobacteria bacterium]
MKNKTKLLYIIILSSFFSLSSCSKMSDVDELNQRANELVNIIEEHKEKDVKDYLTDDFSVVKRFNKKQFLLFIHYHLKRNKSISISILNKDIIHNESYADVTANVLLIGSNKWLPERGQIYTIASRWKKESGDWKMSNLRWEKSEI